MSCLLLCLLLLLLLLWLFCCRHVRPQAGIIPRIFKYLWQRMPEVQAGLLTNPSSSGGGGGGGGGGGSTRSSSSSLVFGDLRRSLHGDEAAAGSSSGARGVEPSLKWLVRCSMLEIHK